MLDRSPPSITRPALGQRRPRRSVQIRGQYLAKARSHEPRERANLAAKWIAGSLTIVNPTARQAADLFGACEALIRAELKALEATTFAPTPIDSVWADLSDRERDGFVRDNLSDLWTRIDHLTS